jgi:MerR family Zn(II)-responsive transcriptional regulator of zntA
MMKVRELALRSGVLDHVVRYYTRIGLLKPARSPRNRYKQYSDSDVLRLHFIRQAKSLGYTLSEIARIFKEASRGKSPCPLVRQIIEHRIEENGRKLNELAALQKRMKRALGEWAKLPDGMPDGESVCYLIESAAHG